jgi:predicted AlkP superfamily phosphohydrolase/phosphomutase/tetratricopeptide (TPR) repeat protein
MNDPKEAPPPRRRVLLIGWDGADWGILNELMDAGRMPHLSRLVGEGVMGNLASLAPCLSPMLWTSVATGKTADKHGILGFVEPAAEGLGIIPSRSTTRRCKALWNLLGEHGLHSCVLAWPVSDPVEPISGVYLSERVLDTLAARPENIRALPEGFVHPERLTPTVSDLRFHPCELSPGNLRDMIPTIGEIDLTADDRPARLARHFARCVTVHSVATQVMETEPWDLFAVYYEMLDHVGHDFMSYRAPQMAGVADEDHRHYRQVVDAVHEFHDQMLGRLLELAGAGTTVILLSDHGFQAGARRPAYRPFPGHGVASEGAEWHRPLGVLAMRGPDLKRDERIYGSSLLDLAPTVLALFGLPTGSDMDGRVLTRAFERAPEVRTIPTWETEPRPGGQAPPVADMEAQAVAVHQLVALGYLTADAVTGSQAAVQAQREANFNLAVVHLHHGRPALALPLFESLCEAEPLQARYELARLHALSRLNRSAEVLVHIARLEALGLGTAALDLLAAPALAATGQEARAMERWERAVERAPTDPVGHLMTGHHHRARSRRDVAEACYRRALALDPDLAEAHSGLAQIELDRGDFANALEHVLASVRLVFWNPQAQFCLAQALEGLGEFPRARVAYEHALSQAPGFGEARYRFAKLLENAGETLLAAEHRRIAFGLAPAAGPG